MTKKFDVVIGNPPYQEEAGGDATHSMPVYHLFMDAAYEVADKGVLITPARFLFNAGYTPKAWNERMLNDPHVSVAHYVPDSGNLFPGTDIKGGIVVTYRDASMEHEPIGTFTKYPELNKILHLILESEDPSLESLGITSGRSYRYTDHMHSAHPEAVDVLSKGHGYVIGTHAFSKLPYLFHETQPTEPIPTIKVLGLSGRGRSVRWIDRDYVSGPKALNKFKVAVPAANGSGALGEALSTPVVLEPNVAVTQTFLTIGAFDTEQEAEACLKYVKSKFARALLGVLKITQHNPARTWKYVPLQDFTADSDIDWSQTIPQIDQQLYAKYGLDDGEIEFIETHVKAMD